MAVTVLERLADEIGADATKLGYYLYRKAIPDHRKPRTTFFHWMDLIYFPAKRRLVETFRGRGAEPPATKVGRIEPTEKMMLAGGMAYREINLPTVTDEYMAGLLYRAMEDARLGDAAPAAGDGQAKAAPAWREVRGFLMGAGKATLCATLTESLSSLLRPGSAVVVQVGPGKTMDIDRIETLPGRDGDEDTVMIFLRERAATASSVGTVTGGGGGGPVGGSGAGPG